MNRSGAVPRTAERAVFERALQRVYPNPAPGFEKLLRLPFDAEIDRLYPACDELAVRHGWSHSVAYSLCFWCFYVHMCLRRGHHETSLWDATAATARLHPDSLKMMPALWSFSDVFGLSRTDLPLGSDVTSGLVRTAWALTEIEERTGMLRQATSREHELAWQFLTRLAATPLDNALAAGLFTALGGDFRGWPNNIR